MVSGLSGYDTPTNIRQQSVLYHKTFKIARAFSKKVWKKCEIFFATFCEFCRILFFALFLEVTLLLQLLAGGAVGLGKLGDTGVSDVEVLGTGYVGNEGDQHGGNGNEEVDPPVGIERRTVDLTHGQNALIHALSEQSDGVGDALQPTEAEQSSHGDEDRQKEVDGVGEEGDPQAAQRLEGDLTVLDAELIVCARFPGGTVDQREVENDGADAAPLKESITLGAQGGHSQGESEHGDGDLIEQHAHAIVGISFKECFHGNTLRFFRCLYYNR